MEDGGAPLAFSFGKRERSRDGEVVSGFSFQRRGAAALFFYFFCIKREGKDGQEQKLE